MTNAQEDSPWLNPHRGTSSSDHGKVCTYDQPDPRPLGSQPSAPHGSWSPVSAHFLEFLKPCLCAPGPPSGKGLLFPARWSFSIHHRILTTTYGVSTIITPLYR